MRVILAYSPALSEKALPTLYLRMVEYDNTLNVKATYTDTDSKVIKIKIGDVITEDILTGKAPNGDLMLIGGPCLLRMYDAWLNNETIRFVVELGSSKYSFSVDGSGFSDSVSSFWAAQETESDGMFYSGTDCVRMDCFFTCNLDGDRVWHNIKGDYELAFDAQEKENIGNVSHYQYMVGIVSDNPFAFPVVHLDDYTDYLEGKYKNEKGSLDWCGKPDEENNIYYMADGRRIAFLNHTNESVCTYDIYIEQSGQ